MHPIRYCSGLQCLSASWAFLPCCMYRGIVRSGSGLQCLSASWAFLPGENRLHPVRSHLVFSAFRLLGHFCRLSSGRQTGLTTTSSVPFGFLGISAIAKKLNLSPVWGLQCLSASWAFLPQRPASPLSGDQVFSAFRLLGHFCQKEGAAEYNRKAASSVPFGFLGISALHCEQTALAQRAVFSAFRLLGHFCQAFQVSTLPF